MFLSPKGSSVFQRDSGVVIKGFYAFVYGKRFELERCARLSGPWEAGHDAFRHLTPENLIQWSDEE